MRRPPAQTNPGFHAALAEFWISATKIAHSIGPISIRLLLLDKDPEMLVPHLLRMPQPNAQGLFVGEKKYCTIVSSYGPHSLSAVTFCDDGTDLD
ncbi:hypothetical protein Ddc_19448 [Ditylenchus destructor]|nr:hypothetical protein Ddc_19448 [Ditylenchus destructor]